MENQENRNVLPLSEVLLAFYQIGLALKYEKKPPDNHFSKVANMAESEGGQYI